MKVQLKKGDQQHNVLQKHILDLRKENQLLKEAALYHKNKFLEEKQEKELYMEKWRKSEQERLELLKQYKVFLTFIEEKNILNSHDGYIQNECSKSVLNNSNIIIETTQKSINQSNLNYKKLHTVSNANDLSKKQNNLQDNLIRSYLTKSKSKISQSQCSNGDKSQRSINNIQQTSMKHQCSESKLMTLKQVTLVDISANKLNSAASAKKFHIPKVTSDRRKSYFEKKKVENKVQLGNVIY